MSIEKRRVAKNLTQQQLADKCGIKQNSISRYEKGVREPSIKVLMTLAKALDCSIDELLRDPEETDCPQVAA